MLNGHGKELAKWATWVGIAAAVVYGWYETRHGEHRFTKHDADNMEHRHTEDRNETRRRVERLEDLHLNPGGKNEGVD